MAQTRMFRDRMVSMEQTLEAGEKHLPLLRDICREAFPDFAVREHSLDHERDLFIMDLEGSDGARKRICWTRMVLFDPERIPSLSGTASGVLRAKIVEHLRARGARPEIIVTFRHLEEGWVEAPEPRREGRRRRRGGRGGGRGAQRQAADRRPGQAQQGRPSSPGGAAPQRGAAAPVQGASALPRLPAAPLQGERGASSGEPVGGGPGGKRRRRFRRRRRGRGVAGGSAGPAGPPPVPKE